MIFSTHINRLIHSFSFNKKIFAAVAAVIIVAGLPYMVFAAGITDNFDSYTAGASLSGQGGWYNGTSPLVTSAQSQTSPNSVIVTATDSGAEHNFASSTDGTASFYFYAPSSEAGVNASGKVRFCRQDDNCNSGLEVSVGTVFSAAVAVNNSQGYTYNAWHSITVSWSSATTTGYFSVDGGPNIAVTRSDSLGAIISEVNVRGNNPTHIYFDTFYASAPLDNFSTHFITVTPQSQGTVPSSTPVTLGSDFYISQSDFASPLKVSYIYSPLTGGLCLGVFGCADAAVTIVDNSPFAISGDDTVFGEYVSATTTQGLLPAGVYNITTTVSVPSYVFFQNTLLSTTTQVTIGAATSKDLAYIQNQALVNSLYNLGTDGGIGGIASTSCAIASFNFASCLAALTIPDSAYLATSTTFLENTLENVWPIGYVTDLTRILSSTTTIPLVVIDATLPSVLPGGGTHIHLDLTHSLDFVLNATSSQYISHEASSSQTFYQITDVYWNYISYVAVILYIIGRVLGGHVIPQKKDKGIKSGSGEDSTKIK